MLSTTIASLALLSGLAKPALSPISTQGTHFVDGQGKTIALRGVNLGGWLVEEMWMTPWVTDPPAGSGFSKVEDHETLWATIEKRLGADGMRAVRTAWRENWIQPADFKAIKSLGFNHVRIPFLASLLDEPGGMEWLHRAVDDAAAAGLYSVLDMHGLPGGQSTEHHTGRAGRNRLWFDVENISEAEKDWAKVAREFGDNPNVAAFDLINEPMGAPNTAMLFLVFDRLYRAIRPIAPNKVLLIEDGYKGFENTPHPNLAEWTQVAYSLHFYDFNAKASGDHLEGLQKGAPKVKELMGYRQTPMYIGEWNNEPNGGASVMKRYSEELDKDGFSWAIWTWKLAPLGKPMGDWGLVRATEGMPALNPFTDSAAQLIEKIKAYRTENMKLPDEFKTAFKE